MSDTSEEIKKLLSSLKGESMEKAILGTSRKAIFTEKLLAALQSDPGERHKVMKQIDEGHKKKMFEALVKLINEIHLHESFVDFISEKNNCSGMTRYAFIMANTQEDWEREMKKLNEDQHKEPILQTEKQFEHRIMNKAKKQTKNSDIIDALDELHKIHID